MTTVFTAVLAPLDQVSKDGRSLRTPVGGIRHRPFPIPVLGVVSEDEQRDRLGVIEALSVMNCALVATGRFFDTDTAADYARRLATGEAWMELDVDDLADKDVTHFWGDATEPPDESTQPTRTEFRDWRVSCVIVGTSPCWDMGPARIEVLDHTAAVLRARTRLNDIDRAAEPGAWQDALTAFAVAVRKDQMAQDAPEMTDGLHVTGVYRVEPDEATGREGSVSLRVLGGSKRYLRVWDGHPVLEDGWTVHESATTLWESGVES